MNTAASTVHTEPAPGKPGGPDPADADELRQAIAAVLMRADEWRDTDLVTAARPWRCNWRCWSRTQAPALIWHRRWGGPESRAAPALCC